MKRYISNYTILNNGEQVINHITTVGDDGRFISVMPFDRELGNTVYVPQPLCVAIKSDIPLIEDTFHRCASRQQLTQQLQALKLSKPQQGDDVAVLRLDFAHNIINQI